MIPTIDIAHLIDGASAEEADLDALTRACGNVGFFALTGHGLSEDALESVREIVREVFTVDDALKALYRITRDDYRGFIPLGFFTPNEQEASRAVADDYEGFKLHWECPPGHPVRSECALYGTNRWVEERPDMRRVILDYWQACDRIAAVLLTLFESALGVEAGALAELFEAPLTNMTLIHYPAGAPDAPAVGIHPHKDTCAFTILHPDPVGGLLVQRRDGQWMEVAAAPGALLVNTGDMMEIWSGGRFVSTPHQVVNRTGAERYSFPYFAVPNHAVTVRPLVEPLPGFDRLEPIDVGHWSAEVWRTNWPDETPSPEGLHLGAVPE